MDPVYLYLFDSPEDTRSKYVITGWGRTLNENKTVCVNIHGYLPYFSVMSRRTSDNEYATAEQLKFAIDLMEWPMKGPWNKPINRAYVKRRTLYYYEEVYVCTVFFENMSSYYAYKKKVKSFESPYFVLEVSDDIASPLIKFFGERDLAPCTWLQIDGTPLSPGSYSKTSICEVEYSIVYTGVTKMNPQPAKIPNFTRLTYDIECYGSNEFGLPKSWKVTDEIIDISVDLTDMEGTYIENHQFCQAFVKPIEGSILHPYSNEKDLLAAFLSFLHQKDPDILETYNGFGFDNPYIHYRYSRYFEYYGKLGRSAMHESTWKDKGNKTGGYSSKTSFFYNNDQRIRMPGRFDLDLYNIIKKEEGRRLKRNTLSAVAKHILGKDKLDMDFREGFEAFRNHKAMPQDEHWQEKMRYFLTYAKMDTELTREIVTKKRTIPNLFMNSSNFGIPPFQLYIGGQQQKLVALIHKEAFKLGITLNKRKADYVDYGGGVVEHPVPGYYKEVFVVDFAGMYPSIMLDKNICLSTFIPDHRRHMYKDEDVWKISTRRGPVHWFVRQPDTDENGKDIDHPVKRRGLIPMIVLSVINGRAEVKLKLKTVVDALAKMILQILEIFYKETANSMYGVLGVQGESGKFSMVEAAEAVTESGATSITNTKYEIEVTHKCVVIYGDTDSKFAKSMDTKRNPHEAMRTVATEVTKKLFGPKSPVKIEPEKVIDLILLMPKKYIYIMLNEKCERMVDDKTTLEKEFGDKLRSKDEILGLLNNPKSREILQKAVKTKGDVMVRKDTCEWQRNVYFDIAFCCFYEFEFEDIVELLYEHIKKLFSGQVKLADLIYVARYNASAKADYFVSKFVDSLKGYGYDIEDGAGLDFVICNTGYDKTAEKMRLPDMIGDTPIDHLNYLEKLIAHVDAVIFARFGHENYFRQTYYCTTYAEISVLTPCRMLHTIIKEGKYPTEYLLYLSKCTRTMNFHEISWNQYMYNRWLETLTGKEMKDAGIVLTSHPARMYM